MLGLAMDREPLPADRQKAAVIAGEAVVHCQPSNCQNWISRSMRVAEGIADLAKMQVGVVGNDGAAGVEVEVSVLLGQVAGKVQNSIAVD